MDWFLYYRDLHHERVNPDSNIGSDIEILHLGLNILLVLSYFNNFPKISRAVRGVSKIQTSKMARFATIVNGCTWLAVFPKHSILDVYMSIARTVQTRYRRQI